MINYLYIAMVLYFFTVPLSAAYLWVWVPRQIILNEERKTRAWKKAEAQRLIDEKYRRDLRARRQALAAMAWKIRKELVAELSRLGFRYRPQSWERKGRNYWKRVVMKHCIIGDDYLVFRIDDIPDRIEQSDLLKEETLKNLRLGIGRPDIKIIPTERDGLFIHVPLQGSSEGIPDMFPWHDSGTPNCATALMSRLMERDPKANYLVPIGLGENRHFYFVDMRKNPHLLIAGTTNSGKSNLLNVVINSFIKHCSPAQLKLELIDLKRVELFPYRRVPHVNEVIYKHELVADKLATIREEMDRRYELLSNHDLRNVQEYNEEFPDKALPRIVVVFDEAADVMLDGVNGAAVTSILERLAALTRAVDINFILCTQRPDVKVITGLIKANVTTRVAFRTASDIDSRIILDVGDAKGLTPQGRGILFIDGQYHLFQAPHITTKQIKTITEKSQTEDKNKTKITPERVMEKLLGCNSLKELNKKLKNYSGYSADYVERVVRQSSYIPLYQKPIIKLNEENYLLWRGRLIKCGQQRPKSPDEIEVMEALWNG